MSTEGHGGQEARHGDLGRAARCDEGSTGCLNSEKLPRLPKGFLQTIAFLPFFPPPPLYFSHRGAEQPAGVLSGHLLPDAADGADDAPLNRPRNRFFRRRRAVEELSGFHNGFPGAQLAFHVDRAPKL